MSPAKRSFVSVIRSGATSDESGIELAALTGEPSLASIHPCLPAGLTPHINKRRLTVCDMPFHERLPHPHRGPSGQYVAMSESSILHLSLPVRDLVASRDFYVDVLGCRLGRTQPEFVDVWFHGLQLTLQRRPDEVRPVTNQGARHFGVALPDKGQFDELVERLRSTAGVHWVTQPIEHPAETLSGKSEFKIADPSGNVIEIKHYADPTEFLALQP